jgi:hypothetical protein
MLTCLGAYVCVREGAKNQYRVRRVPLNETAYWAVSQLLERAKDKGCSLPDHYLLPGRIQRGPYQPDKPMQGWRTAWNSLRAEVAKVHPRLATLRPYDLRHHAITKLAERPGVSEQTIQAIAGHVSQRMLRHYSHIRLQAKREALELLTSAPAPTSPANAASSEMTGEGQNRVQLGASDTRNAAQAQARPAAARNGSTGPVPMATWQFLWACHDGHAKCSS